jgi:hypothetical protein
MRLAAVDVASARSLLQCIVFPGVYKRVQLGVQIQCSWEPRSSRRFLIAYGIGGIRSSGATGRESPRPRSRLFCNRKVGAHDHSASRDDHLP